MKRVRVLIGERRPQDQRALQELLRDEADIRIVGVVGSGAEVLRLAQLLRPDVISLSVSLGDMNAVEIMDGLIRDPIPVLLLSTNELEDASLARHGVERGALDCLWKPRDFSDKEFRREFISRIKRMGRKGAPVIADGQTAKNLVVIGASTGGPKVVKAIVSRFPKDLNAAVLVVQHLSSSFTSLIVAGLASASELKVRLAEDGMSLSPSIVYVSPGASTPKILGFHGGGRVQLGQYESPHRIQPWIDLAMESAAETFGKRCVGVLLTGMGADGVKGMTTIKQRGGVTFAQNEATSMIFGMAKEAIAAGVVDYVMAAPQIAEAVVDQINSLG